MFHDAVSILYSTILIFFINITHTKPIYHLMWLPCLTKWGCTGFHTYFHDYVLSLNQDGEERIPISKLKGYLVRQMTYRL